MMKLTRRKFFFGGAVAAVVVPILATLPFRRAARGSAPHLIVWQGNMTKSDLYIGGGGITWPDDEYNERLAEVTEKILHRRYKFKELAFEPKT